MPSQTNSKVYDIRKIRRDKRRQERRAEKSAPASSIRKKKRKGKTPIFQLSNQTYRILIYAAGLLVVLLILFFALRKNAQEVYVNNVLVGTVSGKALEQELLATTVMEKMQADLGVRAETLDVISIKEVHGNKKNYITTDELQEKIIDNLNYKVEAAEIYIGDVKYGTVASTAAAEELFNRIISEYIVEGTNIIYSDFVEEKSVKNVFVTQDEVMDSERVFNILTAQTEVEEEYTVLDGDSFWGIANKSGISQDKLAELNPGVTPEDLKVGQRLNLVTMKPLLSVKTIEQYVTTGIKEKQSIERENPNESRTYKKIVQQGKDGQAEYTMNLTRINGIETEKTVEAENILVAPVDEIIEVGTK